ncbi:cupin domain-containing protein [Natrinema halophilum]|uniref:Cupin domain-containing protein n=1 Tax=Natrinema halophilum TaxID=1699371 RepID=A0A7D5KBC1_9EURY|nr:cupin domain-containing protein [Natrinema halophilum]QLG47641.1 cupin domain-containing protein [Natrinema halophilum]
MLDRYADAIDELEPGDDEIETTELVVTDDVLVKAFALGPGAELEPHEHADSTNVFHVLEGSITVIRDDERERIDAPGVVPHERGIDHGAHNETDETVIFTASLCPLPG